MIVLEDQTFSPAVLTELESEHILVRDSLIRGYSVNDLRIPRHAEAFQTSCSARLSRKEGKNVPTIMSDGLYQSKIVLSKATATVRASISANNSVSIKLVGSTQSSAMFNLQLNGRSADFGCSFDF